MKLLYVAVMLAGTNAFALTDYTCVSNCTADGTLYGLCISRCSTNDSMQAPKIKQTDYTCVSKCTSSGLMYGLCIDKCSF